MQLYKDSYSVPLSSVNYISSNIECLVLIYGINGGLLKLDDYSLKVWYDKENFEKNFNPFPKQIRSYWTGINLKMAVSDDQNFVLTFFNQVTYF